MVWIYERVVCLSMIIMDAKTDKTRLSCPHCFALSFALFLRWVGGSAIDGTKS